MSTSCVVAFRDGQSTTGIYVHSGGAPAAMLPLLADIHHHTFFRDLSQMRTILLKPSAGWSFLTVNET